MEEQGPLAQGYPSHHTQKVPWDMGSQEMALLGLTTLVGTGPSVGRTSPASQPLEAQGPSEAVAGMKHSEECHLLTPPRKFLEVPKFPPGLHLQGLEKPFQRHYGGRVAERRKGLLFPPLDQGACLLISLSYSLLQEEHQGEHWVRPSICTSLQGGISCPSVALSWKVHVESCS